MAHNRIGSRTVSTLRRLPSLLLPPLLFASSLVSAALTGHKEITQYVQTYLTDKTGLPQNSVNTIAQTRDGYLWFGTEEGLARYDGLRVTVYDTIRDKTLKDNYIQAVAAARDGSLWVGTRTGLTRFHNGRFETYFTAQSPITSILEARDGRLWVGSVEGLYSVHNHQVRLYTTRDGLPDNSITSLAEDSAGAIWAGTAKGLASDIASRNADFSSGKPAFHPANLPATPISALAASRDGSLWVATGHNLLRWKDKILETAPAMPSKARIVTLREDTSGILWLGFDHSGVATMRNGQIIRYAARQGLPDDDVTTIFQDREGHLWIGLFESGVVELRDGSFTSFGEREGLSDNMVWSVVEASDKSIWAGTNSHGLNRIAPDGSVRIYTTRDGLATDTVFALCEASDHTIWIGGEDGSLTHIQNNRITVFRDPAAKGQRVASILQYPGSSDLLVAYHQINGLARFTPPGVNPSRPAHFQHYSLPGLLNTATISGNSVWLGTDHAGVSLLDLTTGAITSYTTRNGLLTNFAQAVYVDRDGVVWAGTSPGGLNRIKNGHVTTYSIDQGLFDLTVGGIVEDNDGYLWMTCNKGIYKVSKQELNDYADRRISAIHSIVYSAADGLRSVECNFAADPSVWKSSDGRIWFATVAGIASIDPANSQIQSRTPSLLIEQVSFDRKSLDPGATITTGPGSGNLEIRFTAPDFVDPQRIRFRYRLLPSDTEWVEVGDRRQAFYTKLPPGKYRFEVQGVIGNANWPETTLSQSAANSIPSGFAQLEIALKPHFWQTATFRVASAFLILLLGAALYRLRVRYLVERNRILEDRVSERTAELQLAIQAEEAAHNALREQASRDSLTGLWNRRSIFEMLAGELLRAQRERHCVALLIADVDHFKLVNDTHGHLIGDTVLQQVAQRIAELARQYDFAGRYGGEEFVIVLSNCSLIDALRRAEEFRLAIAEMPVPTALGPVPITCSFGVAVSRENNTSEQLIQDADEALYCAKRAGRNRVHAAPASHLDYPLQPLVH